MQFVGAQGVVDAYLIPQLVRKLSSETERIKCIILNTLHFCARVDPLTCLKSGIMPVLTVSYILCTAFQLNLEKHAAVETFFNIVMFYKSMNEKNMWRRQQLLKLMLLEWYIV